MNFKTVTTMKKIFNIFVLVAAAAIALVSCNKQEVEAPNPQEVQYEYTFEIAGDTKAFIGDNCVVWESGDQIGVYTDGQNGMAHNAGGVKFGSPVSFSIKSSKALVVGDNVHCYYPYASENSEDVRTVNMSIATAQTEKDQMPMVSLPFTVTEDLAANTEKPVGQILFANLGSVIEFNVYSTTEEYQSETIQSVTFNADKAIAGDFVFNLTKVDYSKEETLAISGYEATTVVSSLSTPVEVPAEKEHAKVVKMVVAPGTYAGNVVVTTDKATYTFSITTAKEFKRSSVKPLGLNLREDVRQENTSSEPEEVTATLTFDDLANRTEYSTSKQVWEQNGIKLTNDKASSTTNVGNYSNPARFYKSSEIKIEAPGNILKLEFNCIEIESKYVEPISAFDGASTKDGIITINLDGTSNAVTYVLSEGQGRVNSLTVTYVGGDYVPPVLESIAVSGDYKTKFIQDEAFSFGAGVVTATYDDGSTRDVTNSATFSGYNMSNVGNQTVTVEYEGVTTTYKITIEEKPVGAKSWKKVTDASTLKAGDVIRIGCDTKNTAAGSMGSQKYFASVSATFSNGVMTSDKAIDITLSGTTGAWILTTNEGTIGTSAAKALNKTGTGTKTWTISISNGNATIKSTNTSCGWIQYNASSPRFLNYASNQTAIQIYRYE